MDDVEQTGVTIIDCESKEFDAGNVWMQKSFGVCSRSYAQLLEYSGDLAGRMFAEIIADFEGYREGRREQEGLVTVASKIARDDALVDFRRMSARKVYCLHSAIGHQERLHCSLSGCPLTLYSLRSDMSKPLSTPYELDRKSRVLHLKCSDGLSVAVDSFGIPGKSNRFTALDIYNHLLMSNGKNT